MEILHHYFFKQLFYVSVISFFFTYGTNKKFSFKTKLRQI